MEGNQQKTREALEFVAHLDDDSYTSYDIEVAVQKARDALSAPPRNCDVGTAEEQAERFHAFCDGHSSGIGGMCDGNCPCFGSVDGCHCLCKWAQMLYEAEEGGAE